MRIYFLDICPVGEEMEIYFTERDEDKLKVFLYDVQLNTKREEDQQIGVQLVKLGFSDCVPGSFLEKIIMDEENNNEPTGVIFDIHVVSLKVCGLFQVEERHDIAEILLRLALNTNQSIKPS
jgi:hypothetical protein